MSLDKIEFPYVWEKQPIILKHMEPPTLNEWHSILDADEPVKLSYLITKQLNDEAADKTVEVRAALSGDTITNTKLEPNDETQYYYISGDFDTLADNTGLNMFNWREAYECSSASIDMRITTALGTNQKLWGHLHYCKLVRV